MLAVAHSPMLWTPSIRREGSIEPGGSAVLYKFGGHYLPLTAGHCLKNSRTGEEINVGILVDDKYQRIQGEMVVIRGEQDQLDIGVVRLDEPSKVNCEQTYGFFEDLDPFVNWSHPTERRFMLLGYPASKVNIDHKKKKATIDPLVYLVEATEEFNFAKYHYRKEQHLLLEYDQRRSSKGGSHTISMAPDPTGISGCGVWLVKSKSGEDEGVSLKLAGLAAEQFEDLRLLVAMKMDLVHMVLQQFLAGKALFQDLFRI